ncbi:MAG TPA: ImmA/IrrE family metallo-endopeptidase [Deinococcales bacterium]|nr:ImmA/IrrE family metallo-endopeptidase [Deinococcales bacterium]
MTGLEDRFSSLLAEFLSYSEDFHRRLGWCCDYARAAEALGVPVVEADRSYTTDGALGEVIAVEVATPAVRQAFSGWHEVSHALFKRALDGDLQARLQFLVDHGRTLEYEIEERFCNIAAARLLMPNHVLEDVCCRLGFTPLAIIELSRSRGASLAAAMRRLLHAHDHTACSLLVGRDWTVQDGLTTRDWTKYNLSTKTNIAPDHPLRQVPRDGSLIEVASAPIPVRRGTDRWRGALSAALDCPSGRVIALYLKNPIPSSSLRNEHQDQLF